MKITDQADYGVADVLLARTITRHASTPRLRIHTSGVLMLQPAGRTRWLIVTPDGMTAWDDGTAASLTGDGWTDLTIS